MKNNSTLKLGLVFSFLIIFLISSGKLSSAQENILFEIGYMNDYIWRGFERVNEEDGVIHGKFLGYIGETGFCTTIDGYYGLVDNRENDSDPDELNFSLFYKRPILKVIEFSVGHTYYTFPMIEDIRHDESQETFVGIGFPRLILTPALTLYRDWDESDGWYLEASIGHQIDLDNFDIDLWSKAGFTDGLYDSESGLSDLNVTLEPSIGIGFIRVSGFITYTYIPLDTVNEDENKFWGGVHLKFLW